LEADILSVWFVFSAISLNAQLWKKKSSTLELDKRKQVTKPSQQFPSRDSIDEQLVLITIAGRF
jgi:hypothetical protein